MLCVDNVSKSFGNLKALDHISLRINPGEIHGLLGMNGSGKSTLLNILSGNPLIQKTGGYSGNMLIQEQEYAPLTPVCAIKAGIGIVRQESALIPGLSITENIKLSREKTVPFTRRLLGSHFAYIDKSGHRADIVKLFKHIGVDVNPEEKYQNLSIELKHFVELAREIDNPRLKYLLLDEPTASLNKEDTQKLFKILLGLSKKKIGMLFVSHKIEEVLSLCQNITIMRDGKIAGALTSKHADLDKVYECMTLQKRVKALRKTLSSSNHPVVVLRDFSANTPMESIKDIHLEIFQEEILGVTSLSGHGKNAFVQGLMGLCETKGALIVNDRRMYDLNPVRMISEGVAYIPEDRHTMGLLLNQSVTENIAFAAFQSRNKFLKKFPFNLFRMFDSDEARKYAEGCIEKYHIRCESVAQKTATLSGGNQQKVCIAGAIATNPRILIVSEPTRGIDVSSKEVILNIFLDINHELSTTIIVVSSELDELKQVCDRIVVFHDGRIRAILPPSASDPEFAKHLC